jgi:uncharacterized protein
MTSPTTDTPLSPQEIDELEALLGSPPLRDEAMPLDALQGFFFALACAPGRVSPSRWMPVALGANPHDESAARLARVRELVLRYCHQCAGAVATEDFALLLYRRDGGGRDLETWCAGYLEGVDAASPSWREAGDPDEVDELLFPFVVLAGELPEEEKRTFRSAEWRNLVRSCEDTIDDAIVRVREYWKALRNPPQTVRRGSPKTGRNAPCPCGSGKKFKQCCGAPESLH